MIYPLPPNIGFSYVAMPSWRWLPVTLPEPLLAPVRAALADVADIESKLPPPEPAPPVEEEPPPPPSLELVFQGYQWQFRAQWYPFVNPGWDHLVDNDPEDILARGIRHERERGEALRQVAARRGV